MPRRKSSNRSGKEEEKKTESAKNASVLRPRSICCLGSSLSDLVLLVQHLWPRR